jgi:hypothetical protein
MQENGGNRYDIARNNTGIYAQGGLFSGYDAPVRGVGHVQAYAADFERSTVDGLYIADAAWQSGDKDWCVGMWVYLESRNWILMCQGGENMTSCWCLSVTSSNYAQFGVGVSGASTGWNDSFRAYASGSALGAAWYYIIARSDASANTCYVYVWNTSGTLLDSDSTGSMNFGSNNGPAITFGHTGSSTYKLDAPVVGNHLAADGRIEQAFLYDGMLSTQDMTDLRNGGAGVTWGMLFGSPGTIMGGNRNFYKNYDKIFGQDNPGVFGRMKKRLLGLPDKVMQPGVDVNRLLPGNFRPVY